MKLTVPQIGWKTLVSRRRVYVPEWHKLVFVLLTKDGTEVICIGDRGGKRTRGAAVGGVLEWVRACLRSGRLRGDALSA